MKVQLDDGAELFYRIDDFTDPWTEPETVLLHHGMAKNHKMWFGWVPVLARHYRVVRFDMRGMGQSTVPEPGYPWTIDNFAKDLLQVADRLELDKFHLIGETVGGSISMRFATLHQERLLSLTACTSPTKKARARCEHSESLAPTANSNQSPTTSFSSTSSAARPSATKRPSCRILWPLARRPKGC